MRISECQKDKLKKAFESNCQSITIRLTFWDLHGEDVIAITNSQLDRLVEAYEEKKGMTIKMSKHNFFGVQYENRRKIFTCVRRIDSIPNRNCSVALIVGALSGLASIKTNWKWGVSQEGRWCLSDRN